MSELAERVLAALPQTQCTRCGYPDCTAYAQAVAMETPYHHAAVADFIAKKPLGFVWERFGKDGQKK